MPWESWLVLIRLDPDGPVHIAADENATLCGLEICGASYPRRFNGGCAICARKAEPLGGIPGEPPQELPDL